MPSFRFEAFDSNGRKRHGEIESSTRESAFAKLERAGMRNIEIEIEDEAIELEADLEVDVVQHDREIEIVLEPDELFDPVDSPELSPPRTVSRRKLKGTYESKYHNMLVLATISRAAGVLCIAFFVFAGIYILSIATSGEVESEFSTRDLLIVLIAGLPSLIASLLLFALAEFIKGFATLCASSERSADGIRIANDRLEIIEERSKHIAGQN